VTFVLYSSLNTALITGLPQKFGSEVNPETVSVNVKFAPTAV
jgi:hypothetical protein